MKVNVTTTIEVDPAVWAHEYGIEESEVRDDVVSFVTAAVADTYVMQAGIAKATTRATSAKAPKR